MKEVRPIQKHLLALPPCPTCGGYRYLIARTRSKTKIELQALCVGKPVHRKFHWEQVNGKRVDMPGESWLSKRTYKTVASVPYSTLNPHEKGIRGSSYAASLDPVLLETFHELQAIVAKVDERIGLVTK